MDEWILETTHSHTKFWNIFSVNFHVQNITRGKILFSLRLFQPLFYNCCLHLKASVLHKCGRVDFSVLVHFTSGSNSLTKPLVLRNQLKINDFHEMWIFFLKTKHDNTTYFWQVCEVVARVGASCTHHVASCTPSSSDCDALCCHQVDAKLHSRVHRRERAVTSLVRL